MNRTDGPNPRAGAALLLALFWSPLAGGAALFFALHSQAARAAGNAPVAAKDAQIASLLCAVAVLAGALELGGAWLLQVAWWWWL